MFYSTHMRLLFTLLSVPSCCAHKSHTPRFYYTAQIWATNTEVKTHMSRGVSLFAHWLEPSRHHRGIDDIDDGDDGGDARLFVYTHRLNGRRFFVVEMHIAEHTRPHNTSGNHSEVSTPTYYILAEYIL